MYNPIDDKTLEIIKMFMSEIGLEKHPDPNAVNLVDQDTGNALVFGNKFIIVVNIKFMIMIIDKIFLFFNFYTSFVNFFFFLHFLLDDLKFL